MITTILTALIHNDWGAIIPLLGCIAIHKKKGVILDEIIYQNCFNRNDDGAGFAYVDKEGKLVVKKGITDVDDFVKAVKEVEEHEMIIHCRLMSKGEVSEANCHPFHVESEQFPQYEFAVIHNGTLNWRSSDKRSDTSFFVEDAIKPIVDRDPYFFEFQLNRAMISAYIGTSNKLCIMRLNKKPGKDEEQCEVFIVNRPEGIEYKGCWFSNLSFTEEVNRWVFDSDRKRIAHWKPKIWKEYKYVPPAGQPHYMHGGHGYQQQGEFFPPDGATGWKYDPDFGWYNPDSKYKGRRNIGEYNAFLKKKNKDGEIDIKDMDQMTYLTKDELKIARRECVSVVKDSFPNFDFKGITTVELAHWARGELRELLPSMKNMTNQAMMNFIIKGNVIAKAGGDVAEI